MWVRMQSVAEARQWLEAGLLYECYGDGRWHPTDGATPQQLHDLETLGDEYTGGWPIEDYAIHVEE